MGLSILATYLVSHCQAKCIVVKPRGKVCACALVSRHCFVGVHVRHLQNSTCFYDFCIVLIHPCRILVGNPLVCDCHLRWLFSFLADTNQQPLVSDIGFCEAPVFNNTIVAVSSIADAEDFGCSKCITV